MGWIKLWRELIKKPIWRKSSPEHCKILITILVMVNYDENEWEWEGKKFMVQPGQMITSIESIRKKADKGISTRNVRSALERFQKLGFLTSKASNQGRLITILNWDSYQGDDRETDNQNDKRVTNDRQTGDKRPTNGAAPIKEVKKVKKDKKGKKKSSSAKPKGDSRIKDLIDYYFDEHKRVFDEPYTITGGKDSMAIKRLLSNHDPEMIKILMTRFLESDDDWLDKVGRTISIFQTRFMAMLQANRKPKPTHRKYSKALEDSMAAGKALLERKGKL